MNRRAFQELRFPLAQLFPVSGDRIESVELLLESSLDYAIELRVGLRSAAHVWDFRATEDLTEARVIVPARYRGWLAFPVKVNVEAQRLYYIHTAAQTGIRWKGFREIDGEPNRCPVGTTAADLPGARAWRPLTSGNSLCLRVTPESRPYAATNVIRDGLGGGGRKLHASACSPLCDGSRVPTTPARASHEWCSIGTSL